MALPAMFWPDFVPSYGCLMSEFINLGHRTLNQGQFLATPLPALTTGAADDKFISLESVFQTEWLENEIQSTLRRN